MKDVLKYKDFIATVHYSEEDEVLYGKIRGIDDSVTFEGSSVVQLKKAFKDAVQDYLRLCRETGKDPHKSYKGSFNIRIDPALHKKAVLQSVVKGISLNQLVEEAIHSFVSKEKEM